ncbi:MAG: hypothetical protein ACLTOV_10815 [Phocaeicola sp.]
MKLKTIGFSNNCPDTSIWQTVHSDACPKQYWEKMSLPGELTPSPEERKMGYS